MSHIVGRVVVGVSGSPGSLQALRFAVSHARAFDATLVPVVAWEPPGGDAVGRPYPRVLTDDWSTAAEHRLLTAFDEGLGAVPTDLCMLPLVVRGPAGRVLVAAADHDHDLLVIGAGRRGRLRRALSDSVSRHCLAHARCTVIAVPPSPLADELGRTWWGLRRRRAPRDGADVLEQPRHSPRPHRDRIYPTGPGGIRL
jgi:nucleotide-binding universal stress UspA family protein